MLFDIWWVRGLLHGMLLRDLEKRLVFPQQTKESIDSRTLASPTTSPPPPNTPLRRIFTYNQPLALVACEGCNTSLSFFSIKGSEVRVIKTLGVHAVESFRMQWSRSLFHTFDNFPTGFQMSCKFFTWVMLQRNMHMASKWVLSNFFTWVM
jgi:hypothetical protein